MSSMTIPNARNVMAQWTKDSPPISDAVSSVILAPRREHSRKPDEAYERIEGVFGDVPRIELFALVAVLDAMATPPAEAKGVVVVWRGEHQGRKVV